MAAKLIDIKNALKDGGILRFFHDRCHEELIHASGQHDQVDGRSYQAFLRIAEQYARHETGSIETGNLVIEWKAR